MASGQAESKARLDDRSRALGVIDHLEPINVGMHGRAAALVEPDIYGRVCKLEEDQKKRPTDKSVLEELNRRKNDALESAQYYLIEEDPERVAIFNDLSQKGFPVQEYWSTGITGAEGEMYVSPKLGERATKLNPSTIPYDQKFEDMTDQMVLIGRMHGEEQVMHGHPHGGNMLKDASGHWVILDSKRCERKEVNWGDPDKIFEAFQRDYMMAGRSLHMARIERGDLSKMAAAMAGSYPAVGSETDRQVQELIKSEFEKQYHYFDRGDEFITHLKDAKEFEGHRDSLRSLSQIEGPNGEQFIQSDGLKDTLDDLIQGRQADSDHESELEGLFTVIGVSPDEASPELVGAWKFLKRNLEGFEETHSDLPDILMEKDQIPGFMGRAIRYSTHRFPESKVA